MVTQAGVNHAQRCLTLLIEPRVDSLIHHMNLFDTC